MRVGCGLIKDWKERYFKDVNESLKDSCGLIKDWKERYFLWIL